MSKPCIHILMACFNGEKFVAEQIDSILFQTYTNWHLTIRDDGSTDNTKAILEVYQHQHPQQISLLTDDAGNVGSVLNFSLLLQQAANDNYIMFCDQDDKWLPDKIAITLKRMQELEKTKGTEKPLLVFTDFLYVDEAMQPIPSKKDFRVTKIKEVRLAHLFAQNHIYGCTMMMNGALAKLAGPIPAEAENHDYWVALVASAFGFLSYIKQRTILYRQHNRNVSGNYDNSSFKKRFQRNILQRRNVKDMIAKHAMLLTFRERYGLQMRADLKQTLDDFIHYYDNKSIATIIKNIRNGVRSQTLIQSLLVYLTILFLPKKKASVHAEKSPSRDATV